MHAFEDAHQPEFADEHADALRETFILRKTSLDQQQWDTFLSPDVRQDNGDDGAREATALLGRKSGLSQVGKANRTFSNQSI